MFVDVSCLNETNSYHITSHALCDYESDLQPTVDLQYRTM